MHYCYLHWASEFSLLIKHRHDNNCSTTRAVLVLINCTYKVVKPAQLESNTFTPSVTLSIVAASLLKNCKSKKHDSLKAEWEQSQQALCETWESQSQSTSQLVESNARLWVGRRPCSLKKRNRHLTGTTAQTPVQLWWRTILANRGIHQHLQCLAWRAEDCLRLCLDADWCQHQHKGF